MEKEFVVVNFKKYGNNKPVKEADFGTIYEAINYIDNAKLFGFAEDLRILNNCEWRQLLQQTWHVR